MLQLLSRSVGEKDQKDFTCDTASYHCDITEHFGSSVWTLCSIVTMESSSHDIGSGGAAVVVVVVVVVVLVWLS